MTFVAYKLIASVLIFLASLLTVIYPLKTRNTKSSIESYEVAEAFASGVFLGVAFFHMLPNSIHIFQQLYGNQSYPFAEMICISGFLLLIFLERLSYLKKTFNPQVAIPYIMALILLIHSLTEGIALGIENTYAEAVIIFIAIFAHKGCDSFALCVTLMRYNLTFWRIVFIIFLFSLTTPLGIAIGTLMTMYNQSRSDQLIAAIFNAFAAGSFLYIATLHHIRFHHHDETMPMLKFSGLFIGALTMAVIAIWV